MKEWIAKNKGLLGTFLIALIILVITSINSEFILNPINFFFSTLDISNLPNQKDRIEYLIKILTISGAAIGTALATWRSIIANKNNKIQQNNERYAKAVELLGHKSEGVRIGALYTLKKLCEEQGSDYCKTCFDVIARYIRYQTAVFNKEQPVEESEEDTETIYRYLPEDIKTAINILSNRSETEKINLKGLDWKNVDLSNTDIEFKNFDLSNAIFEKVIFRGKQDLSTCILASAKLQGADLGHANLQEVDIELAYLEGADLRQANLQGTYLTNAILYKANLKEANLKNAYLGYAILMEAKLQGADLGHANLQWANLQDVIGLKFEQLKDVIIDENTVLPDYLEDRKQELLNKTEMTA